MTNNNQVNDTRYADLMKEIREFGRDMANGNDALPKLFSRVVTAAVDGVISLEKDENGKDDANKLYGEFIKSESKKAVHEHTAGGIKANESKVRRGIEFGCLTRVEPLTVLAHCAEVRSAAVEAGAKVKPAFAAYVDMARAQIASDTALTEDELSEIVRKKAADDPTVEKILTSIIKKLDDLITGAKGVTCKSPHVIAAHDNLKAELDMILARAELEELMEKAAILGLEITAPQAAE